MLYQCILVAVGGGSGAVLRAVLSDLIKKHSHISFPVATFFINLTGSFLLGLLLQYSSGTTVKLLIGTGVLGGYTTFSTFHYETILLLRSGKRWMAILYYLLSVLLGLFAAWAGFSI